MNVNTHIQWTEATWNPLTGCDKVSPGCKNCYAEWLTKTRLVPAGNPRYRNGFKLTLHPDLIDLPRHWRKGKKVFVNSMSDMFHKNVPLPFTQKVFETMNACPQHVFQILTKRGDILVQHAPQLQWTPNIWMGVSVENKDYLYRLDELRQTPAHVKFVSFEPLLGPIPNANLAGIDWVIVGGESGRNFRAMDPDWARDLRDQCQAQGVKFFFKQWSGVRPKRLGRLLDGKLWEEMPK